MVQCPSFRPSIVCVSRQSTTSAAAGGYAAEVGRGPLGTYRSIAAAAVRHAGRVNAGLPARRQCTCCGRLRLCRRRTRSPTCSSRRRLRRLPVTTSLTAWTTWCCRRRPPLTTHSSPRSPAAIMSTGRQSPSSTPLTPGPATPPTVRKL